MQIEVRLYATLSKYAPNNDPLVLLDLPDGALAIDILRTLKIEEDEELVLLVNGRPAEKQQALREGDKVVMFPPVAGG